jgi:very-short-patch-repair endonuclease
MPIQKTLSAFITEALLIHGGKYDYSLAHYVNTKTKVKIRCKAHGVYEQIPGDHLQGRGCSLCGGTQKHSTKSFIKKAKEIHGDRYKYHAVEYKTSKDKVKIICKEHGEFMIEGNAHLRGSGCRTCSYNLRSKDKTKSIDTFKKDAINIHGLRYDYSKSLYHRNNKAITIICPVHGAFEQTPKDHLNGCGCPKCNASKGELKIHEFLKRMGISYSSQKRFQECRGLKYPLAFDFFIPSKNLLIEYDGEQHFIPKRCFGGQKGLRATQQRDKTKDIFANKHRFNLLRIKYTEYNRIDALLSQILNTDYKAYQLSLFTA